MAWSKFSAVKNRLEVLGIKSILGVVPECQDSKLDTGERATDFFGQVRKWNEYGDAIAQHGTFHVYDKNCAGLLGINPRSEFAGHDSETQFERIKYGKEILVREGVWQPWFMAPAHSFDENTVDVLKKLGFKAITDGYGFYPYSFRSLIMVPQLTSFPINVGFGYSTICLHINSMEQRDIEILMEFVENNAERFVDFKSLVNDEHGDKWGAALCRLISSLSLKIFRYFRVG